MRKIIILILLFFIISFSFAQETYRPYFEGYVDKKPYHNKTPYALQSHSQVIEDDNETVYYIDVSGTLNPLNEELVIENIGDKDIINPRITINDKWNWHNVKLMTEEVIRGAKTDKEKAIAIWQFIYNNRHYFQPPSSKQYGDDINNPVKCLNVYGYLYCGGNAMITGILAKMAGLDARYWGLSGHLVAEIYFDNKWNIFDAELGTFYLNRDNKTIAGMDELEKDPWLVERTFHPDYVGRRQCQPRATINISRSEENKSVARWYATPENNRVRELNLDNQYEMNLTLRPGEKIILRWDNIGKYQSNLFFTEPPIYANGKIIYIPDLTNNSYRNGIVSENNIKSIGDDGLKPNIHVDKCYFEGDRSEYRTEIIYKVTSPYVIVGGKIGGDFYRNDTYGDVCLIEISFDGERWTPIWFAKSTGWINHFQEIDNIICPIVKEAKYEYFVKVKFIAAGTGLWRPADPGDNTQAGMDNFKIETDFQVSPFSIPELSLGKNKIKYTDQTKGGHKVKITHQWYQRENNHYPEPPTGHLEFTDVSIVNNLPVLKWEEASDPDKNDIIVDYHIQLSDRADCKWALSPNFDVDLGFNGTEWQIPEGWLNSDQTYYWRVKAKDNNGNWSRYSKIWSFRNK